MVIEISDFFFFTVIIPPSLSDILYFSTNDIIGVSIHDPLQDFPFRSREQNAE